MNHWIEIMAHFVARTYAVCILLTLASALVGCSESVVPPMTPTTLEQAIVNGSPDPQVVDLTDGQRLAIGWLHTSGYVYANFCTGTLIAPRVVATAKHCTVDSEPGDIGFAIGPSPNHPVASFDVAEIHEDWWTDMALLVLDEDATSVVPEVTPIAANTEPVYSDDIGRELDAAGYGETYDTNPAGRWFAHEYLASVDDTTIVVDGRGEQGICYGDSGGPALWERSDGDVVVVAVEWYGDDSCVDRDTMTRLDALYDDFIEPVLDAQPAADPCKGLDYQGRCDGTVVEWCDQGVVHQRDCSTVGTTCGWINDDVGNDCTCGDIDYLGRCDGNIVEWCDGGQYRALDCSSNGEFCGWVDQDTGYYCVDTQPTEDPGSDVPTTDPDQPSDPTTDPATGEPTVDSPDSSTTTEPLPTSTDDEIRSRQPDGPEAVGCTQAKSPASPSLFVIALFGLLIVTHRRR